MTLEEFERLISEEPALAGPIRRATEAMPGSRATFGTSPAELAAIAVLFPVATFVVKEMGLPWLHEAKGYLDLWRTRFHNWVDRQYREHGLDPDAAEAAGEALRKELEKITDSGDRSAWERLASLLKDAGSGE